MEKNRSENLLLNTMKGIACLLVILIHCPMPGMVGNVFAKVGLSSVPFFMMISGYFFSGQDFSYEK